MGKPVAKLTERQTVAANLRKAICEAGGSFKMCSLVSCLQERMHYENLGRDMSTYYHDFLSNIKTCPHPGLGLWMYEPPELCGMLGYNYSFFELLERSTRAHLVDRFLTVSHSGNIDDEGNKTVSLALLFGKAEKYKKFVKDIDAPDEWPSLFTQKPQILFRKPQDRSETLAMIYKKSLNPSLSESFTFQSSNRLHTSCVYYYISPSITVLGDYEGKKALERKTNLLTVFKRCKETMMTYDAYGLIDMSFIFPSLALYSLIKQNCIENRDRVVLEPKMTLSKPRFITLPIPRGESLCTLSLKEVVVSKWFNIRTRGTSREHRLCWEEYEQRFNWLKEDIFSTLEASPFDNILALADYINSFQSRITKMKALAHMSNKSNFQSTIKSLIKNHYVVGYIRSSGFSNTIKDDIIENEIDKTIHKLSFVGCVPLTTKDKVTFVRNELKRISEMIPNDISHMEATLLKYGRGNRAKILACSTLFKQDDLKLKNFIKAIDIIKRGVTAVYLSKQKFNIETKRYEGYGQLAVSLDSLILKIDIDGDKLRVIYVAPNKVNDLMLQLPNLRNFLKEIGVYYADYKTSDVKVNPFTSTISRDRPGARLIMTNDLVKPFNFDEEDITAEITENSELKIECTQEYYSGKQIIKRTFTIIKCRFKYDWRTPRRLPSTATIRTPFPEIFMLDSPCKWDIMMQKIKSLHKEYIKDKNKIISEGRNKEDTITLSDIKSFLRESFFMRLNYKNPRYNFMTDKIVEKTDDFDNYIDDYTDMFLDQLETMHQDIDNSSSSFSNNNADDRSAIEIELDDLFNNGDTDIEMMKDMFDYLSQNQPSVSVKRFDNQLAVNKMWDNVLNEIIHRNTSFMNIVISEYKIANIERMNETQLEILWLIDYDSRPDPPATEDNLGDVDDIYY